MSYDYTSNIAQGSGDRKAAGTDPVERGFTRHQARPCRGQPPGKSRSNPNSEKGELTKDQDWAEADRAYRREFRQYGIDLDALEIEKSSSASATR